MRKQLDTPSDKLEKPLNLVADTGYYSEANVTACVVEKIAPLYGRAR